MHRTKNYMHMTSEYCISLIYRSILQLLLKSTSNSRTPNLKPRHVIVGSIYTRPLFSELRNPLTVLLQLASSLYEIKQGVFPMVYRHHWELLPRVRHIGHSFLYSHIRSKHGTSMYFDSTQTELPPYT